MDRIEQLKVMLLEDPQDPFLHHALGMEYLATNKDEEARGCFEMAIAADDLYIAAYYQLGFLLEKLQDVEGAKKVLEKGLEKCVTNTKTAMEFRQALLNLDF